MVEETKDQHENQEEINEMFDDMQGQNPEPKEETSEESPKEESKEEPKEEISEEKVVEPEPIEEPAQEDEEPVRESSSKEDKDNEVRSEEPVTEKVPETKEEEPVSELDMLKQQLAARDKTIDELSTIASAPKPTPQPKTEEAPKAKAPKEQEQKGPEPPKSVPYDNSGRDIRQFVTKENMQEILRDPNKFNQVLGSVYNSAVENTIVNVPQLVQRLIKQQTTLNAKVEDFYKRHEDLIPYRKFIGYVANELSSQNPSWGLDELFDNVEKETRKRLSLNKAKASQAKAAAKTKPAFAKTKKSAKRDVTGDNLTNLEKELKDLM
tara:strand:- start:2010 stop:2978 length:969 start_codon:yes stop_codon:yes gene_type:complete